MKRKRSVKAKSYHTEDKLHMFHTLALFCSLPTQSFLFLASMNERNLYCNDKTLT